MTILTRFEAMEPSAFTLLNFSGHFSYDDGSETHSVGTEYDLASGDDLDAVTAAFEGELDQFEMDFPEPTGMGAFHYGALYGDYDGDMASPVMSVAFSLTNLGLEAGEGTVGAFDTVTEQDVSATDSAYEVTFDSDDDGVVDAAASGQISDLNDFGETLESILEMSDVDPTDVQNEEDEARAEQLMADLDAAFRDEFGDYAENIMSLSLDGTLDLDGNGSDDATLSMSMDESGMMLGMTGLDDSLPSLQLGVGFMPAEDVDVPLIGSGGDDELIGSEQAENFNTGSGDDSIMPGLGADYITTGGGRDIISGTPAELDGDTISDFTDEDLLLFEDAVFDQDDLTVTTGSAILDVDTDSDGEADTQITLEGEFEGMSFAVNDQGDTATSIAVGEADTTETSVDERSDGGDNDDDDAFGFVEILLLAGAAGLAYAAYAGGWLM